MPRQAGSRLSSQTLELVYPIRTKKPRSPEALALREVAALRQSHWMSNVFAWLGGVAGALAVYILVAGTHQAAKLPTAPRPNVGPGFSESTTAAVGAMLFGFGFSLLALVLVGLAFLHAKNRLLTLAFSLPAVLCISLLLFARAWAP